MKTLSEERREQAEKDRRAHLARLATLQGILEASDKVPPDSWLDVEAREFLRLRLRQGLTSVVINDPDRVRPHPVACDHCGVQLINPRPGVVLASSPAKLHASCAGCGWKGYRTRR